jgi:pyruvate/2-oxoglutarate dehydrogenase complex dihydrolipoamide acyltransferase (E2) component
VDYPDQFKTLATKMKTCSLFDFICEYMPSLAAMDREDDMEGDPESKKPVLASVPPNQFYSAGTPEDKSCFPKSNFPKVTNPPSSSSGPRKKFSASSASKKPPVSGGNKLAESEEENQDWQKRLDTLKAGCAARKKTVAAPAPPAVLPGGRLTDKEVEAMLLEDQDSQNPAVCMETDSEEMNAPAVNAPRTSVTPKKKEFTLIDFYD